MPEKAKRKYLFTIIHLTFLGGFFLLVALFAKTAWNPVQALETRQTIETSQTALPLSPAPTPESSPLPSDSLKTNTRTATSSPTLASPLQTQVVPLSPSTLQVTTKTSEAAKVEYYSRSAESGQKTYLGSGARPSPEGREEWNLKVDSNQRLPSGEYGISAKIQKRDGSVVESNSAKVRVEHVLPPLSETEKEKFKNSRSDSDQDGVSDSEEIRLGTHPQSADSDNDGFLDGDEVKNGFNPAQFSAGDKSDRKAFESPKAVEISPERAAQVRDERFQVEKIEKTVSTAGTPITRFSGKALPDIFVTLYIYSDPIIVTVRTDAEGNWIYELDKELPDGEHEVYVAVTDNVGKITAQSAALPFVKSAQAINIQPAQAAESEDTLSPFERSRTELVLIAAILAISFLGIATVIIGRKSKNLS